MVGNGLREKRDLQREGNNTNISYLVEWRLCRLELVAVDFQLFPQPHPHSRRVPADEVLVDVESLLSEHRVHESAHRVLGRVRRQHPDPLRLVVLNERRKQTFANVCVKSQQVSLGV